MYVRFLTFLVVCCLSVQTFPQTWISGWIDESLLKGRVKQVEEFMARFNNEEDWEGKRITEVIDSAYRTCYLRTLFDLSRFRKDNNELTESAERFIQDVIRGNYQLHFTDSLWQAKVQCKALVNRKSFDIVLCLRPHLVAPHEYVWMVTEAESSLFARVSGNVSHPFLSPTEHEIGFTGLLSLPTEQQVDVSRLFITGTATDHLSMLALLIKNGWIRFTSIEHVEYQFSNIPGYTFVIERIEHKKSYNTGWLITHLTKHINP